MIVPFFVFSAATGAPLAGLSLSFAYLRRREADGTVTNLIGSAPTITDKGLGLYEFDLSDAWFLSGSTLGYVIDCTTDAASRYIEDLITTDADDRVSFFVHSAATGDLLGGVSAVFTYYERRNANGTLTDLADPGITDKGAGLYEFTIVHADLVAGSRIKYVVDTTTASAGRYVEGELVAEAPLVALVSPPQGTLSASTPMVFDVTAAGGLRRVDVDMIIRPAAGGGISVDEVALSAEGFGLLYSDAPNSKSTITNGFRVTLLRRGGWPAEHQVRERIDAIDRAGNEV